MPLPKLPTFSFPINNAKLLKILDAAAQAQEIADIIAPFINRPVSWRSISSAAFDSISLLERRGLVSNELSSALTASVSQVSQIQNTANTLQSLTTNLNPSNFQQSLFAINNVTSTLTIQSASLTRTSDYWVDVVDSNEQRITVNNTTAEVQDSIDQMNEYINNNAASIANSLSTMNSLASTINSFGVDATGVITNVNSALNVVNDVANTAAAVANIANNMEATVNNVKAIANNFKKIDKLFDEKRKGDKKIPKLPAAIDPRNSEYYTIYASINTTIDTLNTASNTLSSIPTLPFLS
jgi:prefoldin subunit 5